MQIKDTNGLVYQKTILDLLSENSYSKQDVEKLESERKQIQSEMQNQKFKLLMKLEK